MLYVFAALFTLLLAMQAIAADATTVPTTHQTTAPMTRSNGDHISTVAMIPPTVHVDRDIAFLSPDRAEKADLYRPAVMKPGERLPVVVLIHGGGFIGGDKGKGREINVGTNLALRGMMALSINYKLMIPGQATFPDCLHDAKTAVRWLRVNAERLQIDPDRIAVFGGSAGGHLAAMIALTRAQDGFDPAEPYGGVSSQVACCVDFYGPADLMTWHDVRVLNKTRAEDPELYEKASPATYVRKDAPPMLIVHGTKDDTVNLQQSEDFAALLTKAGADVQFVKVEGAGHAFDLQPRQRDLRPLVLDFFARHLLDKKK